MRRDIEGFFPARSTIKSLNYQRREENQLGATECFIALIICSTCFGHLYAHHQEFETILCVIAAYGV